MQYQIPFIVVLLVAVVSVASGRSQDPVLNRVQIQINENGKTVLDGSGQPLRGASIGLYKYGRDSKYSDYLYDPAYWQLLEDSGFNAVRAFFFDPWQRSHGKPGRKKPYPHADLTKASDIASMLKEFDHVVRTAREKGFYVLINYHDTGGYRDPVYSVAANKNQEFSRGATMNYVTTFWRFVAPRYADQKHVFYELTNEPVKWTAEKYTREDLLDLKQIYDQVRTRAPETHIVMLTFANHASFGGQRTMLDVAREMKQMGISFDNESVGFHPYNGYHPKPNSGQHIKQLMREFPVINTEQNYPRGTVVGSRDPDASGWDGDRLGVQSCERLGISWFHWHSDSPRAIKSNFHQVILPDARKKGYLWISK